MPPADHKRENFIAEVTLLQYENWSLGFRIGGER